MSTDDTSPAALLPIPSEDFERLKDAIAALTHDLVLEAGETEDGDAYISVDTDDRFYGPTRVDGQVVAHVVRVEAGWAVAGPEGGDRQFAPGAIEAVAAYLAFGGDDEL